MPAPQVRADEIAEVCVGVPLGCTDHLNAHVVGASIKVLTHALGDLLAAPPRKCRLQQAVRATLGDIGVVEAQPAPVVRVVRELEVVRRHARAHARAVASLAPGSTPSSTASTGSSPNTDRARAVVTPAREVGVRPEHALRPVAASRRRARRASAARPGAHARPHPSRRGTGASAPAVDSTPCRVAPWCTSVRPRRRGRGARRTPPSGSPRPAQGPRALAQRCSRCRSPS